jgi:uncharacterized protein (TIGR00369 family)
MALPPFDATMAERLVAANAKQEGLGAYLGMSIEAFDPGRVVVKLPVRDELLTPFGNLHGGVMAALVDHTTGIVVYPHMTAGHWAATTEFKLNYLAPVKGGDLYAEATLVSMTKRTAVVRADVTNEGRLVCIAQGTLLVVEPKS